MLPYMIHCLRQRDISPSTTPSLPLPTAIGVIIGGAFGLAAVIVGIICLVARKRQQRGLQGAEDRYRKRKPRTVQEVIDTVPGSPVCDHKLLTVATSTVASKSLVPPDSTSQRPGQITPSKSLSRRRPASRRRRSDLSSWPLPRRSSLKPISPARVALRGSQLSAITESPSSLLQSPHTNWNLDDSTKIDNCGHNIQGIPGTREDLSNTSCVTSKLQTIPQFVSEPEPSFSFRKNAISKGIYVNDEPDSEPSMLPLLGITHGDVRSGHTRSLSAGSQIIGAAPNSSPPPVPKTSTTRDGRRTFNHASSRESFSSIESTSSSILRPGPSPRTQATNFSRQRVGLGLEPNIYSHSSTFRDGLSPGPVHQRVGSKISPGLRLQSVHGLLRDNFQITEEHVDDLMESSQIHQDSLREDSSGGQVNNIPQTADPVPRDSTSLSLQAENSGTQTLDLSLRDYRPRQVSTTGSPQQRVNRKFTTDTLNSYQPPPNMQKLSSSTIHGAWQSHAPRPYEAISGLSSAEEFSPPNIATHHTGMPVFQDTTIQNHVPSHDISLTTNNFSKSYHAGVERSQKITPPNKLFGATVAGKHVDITPHESTSHLTPAIRLDSSPNRASLCPSSPTFSQVGSRLTPNISRSSDQNPENSTPERHKPTLYNTSLISNRLKTHTLEQRSATCEELSRELSSRSKSITSLHRFNDELESHEVEGFDCSANGLRTASCAMNGADASLSTTSLPYQNAYNNVNTYHNRPIHSNQLRPHDLNTSSPRTTAMPTQVSKLSLDHSWSTKSNVGDMSSDGNYVLCNQSESTTDQAPEIMKSIKALRRMNSETMESVDVSREHRRYLKLSAEPSPALSKDEMNSTFNLWGKVSLDTSNVEPGRLSQWPLINELSGRRP